MKVKVPKGAKIVVVGDIHEHEEQFDKLIEKVKPSPEMFFVSVGDIYDKGFGKKVAESITNKIKSMVDEGVGYVIRGNHELKNIRIAKRTYTMTDELKWFEAQPLSISFEFPSRALVTVVHGGVTPTHTWRDLEDDIETCYVRDLDENGKYIKLNYKIKDGKKVMEPSKSNGKPWHKSYDGRFGYIVSGHQSQKDGVPKFYNYSCNLDTAVYHTGILTAQVFNNQGNREELITITGKAKHDNLDRMFTDMAKGSI